VPIADRDVETQPPGSTIRVSDYGVEPDTGEDVTEGILDAFAAANTEGATIVFESGEYHVASRAPHYDTGVNVPLFDLEGYTDLTIRGNGARLMPRNWSLTFFCKDCTNLTIEGLTVDWERDLPFTEGRVVAETSDHLDIEVRSNSSAREGLPVTNFYFWDEAKGRVAQPIYSQEHDATATSVPRDGVVRCPKAEDEPDSFTVKGESVSESDPVIVRHVAHAGFALKMYAIDGLTLRDLTFHSNPGIGLEPVHCADVTAENVAFERTNDHWLGHIAGAFITRAPRGEYEYRNITVESSGDDWTAWAMPRWDVERADGTTLVATTGLQLRAKVEFHGYEAGHEVAVAHEPDRLDPQFTATVESVDMAIDERQGGRAAVGTLTLDLDRDVPQSVVEAESTQVYNTADVPESVLIENATVGPVRGGARFRMPNVTVRDSTIENTGGALWFHGLPRGVAPDDGTVENCTLRNVVYRYGVGGAAVLLQDGTGMTVTGNTLSHERPETVGIQIDANDTTLSNNDVSGMPADQPIVVGRADCETVTIDGQSACNR
jgi:hypothetical protein